MTKPYRCLIGSFRQDGNEFSRGDRVQLTDEELAANPDAFEPWDVVQPNAAPEPTNSAPEPAEPAAPADSAPEPATKAKRK